ncbi:rhomboid family intramembrane serine protease [Bacteroidetes bacterium endosymbiont of Geopemphigus sp.]|uniref:rhomboid family intramembrane serine protease n=1 Tax=Bacteroidetes bacterium endosymbiont of Geopemphigus sp. TaxID=2047937 RepID=UPI003977BA3C
MLEKKQCERLLTSGFLHADWAHLFFNMLTLYFFGPVVINHFSNNLFLFIYFGSILGGWLF